MPLFCQRQGLVQGRALSSLFLKVYIRPVLKEKLPQQEVWSCKKDSGTTKRAQ